MKSDTIQELERFLQIQEYALGAVSPDVAVTLCKLANLYAANGHYDKAETLHKRALEIRQSAVAPSQSEIEDSKRSLARLAQLKKKGPIPNQDKNVGKGDSNKLSLDEAIKEMELEVSLLKQMVGENHPAVAESLTKLADLYYQAKMIDQMEPLLTEALRIRQSSGSA